MGQSTSLQSLISTTNLQEHFKNALDQSLKQNSVQAEQETVFYIVQVLINFLRSDQLFEKTDDGLRIKPLALHYIDALQQASQQDRDRALRQLGDVALFVSGFFADSLERRPIDVDYYIAMGENAYGCLAENNRSLRRSKVFASIFAELSEKFSRFVDVLAEIGDHANMRCSVNILRLYELWVKTGSQRAARRLRALGIDPALVPATQTHH